MENGFPKTTPDPVTLPSRLSEWLLSNSERSPIIRAKPHRRRLPLQIITYPHPTLRKQSKPLRRVDTELRQIVRQMFDLMYAAEGVGLAANQVDLPMRFFVVNLDAEAGKGEELVFINPVVSQTKGSEESEEGCLSLPGLYGNVVRPKQVMVNAYNLAGEEIKMKVTGLFSRVIQHELDHLNGVLFPDRMSTTALAEARPVLNEFEIEFNSRRATGGIPTDAEIGANWAAWEKKFC
jgi:peptide deformylase